MNHQEARELNQLLFGFMGLFHEKFLIPFRQYDKDLPGMKKNHYKILGILFQHQFLTSTEIGRRLDIEKGSLTTLIDQLAEKELVIRCDDPNDRRKSQISLSNTGRQEMNQIINQHAQLTVNFLHRIDAGETEQFLECMRYVVAYMAKI